jgi:hypothetical protein
MEVMSLMPLVQGPPDKDLSCIQQQPQAVQVSFPPNQQ